MGIKSPSQLYMEGHPGNFLMCRLKGDKNVQIALDSQLSRESIWVRKSSTVSQCNQIFEEISENPAIPTPENSYNFVSSLQQQTPILKKAVRDTVLKQFQSQYEKQAQDLQVQGEFLELLVEEGLDVTWKSYIHGVPRGVMSFAMRSATTHWPPLTT